MPKSSHVDPYNSSSVSPPSEPLSAESWHFIATTEKIFSEPVLASENILLRFENESLKGQFEKVNAQRNKVYARIFRSHTPAESLARTLSCSKAGAR